MKCISQVSRQSEFSSHSKIFHGNKRTRECGQPPHRVPRYTATYCKTLQHATTTRCRTLQNTATRFHIYSSHTFMCDRRALSRTKCGCLALWLYFLLFIHSECRIKKIWVCPSKALSTTLHARRLFSFLLSWVATTDLKHWTKQVVSTDSSPRTQETVPDRDQTVANLDTKWIKTFHNVCGLACILGLTSPHNQVSLTTKEHSAQGMVPPQSGRKGTKSPQCPPSSTHHTHKTRYLAGNAHSGWALYDFRSSRSQTTERPGTET